LAEAVAVANDRAQQGDVVLLAPGGTSFDEFSDYEARGRKFKELVAALPVSE
jgi:UDP-N-acetylmuramoylalanine--D-glutamate ligase